MKLTPYTDVPGFEDRKLLQWLRYLREKLFRDLTALEILKLTTAERDAVNSPEEGMLIYNKTTKVYEFYNGTSWGPV